MLQFSCCAVCKDITLESMVDWLVGDVAKSLPQFPTWACLLCFEEDTLLGSCGAHDA